MLMIPAVIAIQGLAVRVWPSQKHPVELMVLEQFTPGVALLAMLSTVVLAPIIEEMLFRGIIQGWLSRLLRRKVVASRRPRRWPDPLDRGRSDRVLGPREDPQRRRSVRPRPDRRRPGERAAVRQSAGSSAGSNARRSSSPRVFFAAMHLPQWPAPIAIFLLSMGLGACYQRTGSLLAAITMHGDIQWIQYGPDDPGGHRSARFSLMPWRHLRAD